MMDKVCIIGCGWLGFPLSQSLVKKGYEVAGSATSEDKFDLLTTAEIKPFLFNAASEEPIPESTAKLIVGSDLLIICFPPRIRKFGAEFGISMMKNLIRLLPTGNYKVMYTSSTSIYAADNSACVENDMSPLNVGSKNPFQQIEYLLEKCFKKRLTIARLGGLMGYDRIPLKYYVGKKELSNGSHPVNYVHRDDAIAAIHRIIDLKSWGEIYNIVAPKHPTRKKVFQQIALSSDYATPIFTDENEGKFKIIDSSKIIQQLGFDYQFDDPANFSYDY